MYRAEVLVFVTIPREIVRILGLNRAVDFLVDGAMDIFGEGAGGADGGAGEAVAAAIAGGADGSAAADVADASGSRLAGVIDNARRFSGFFSYVTSRWSLACFAVVS